MKLSNERGFTIIEVLLFLAITGLLVMGVLASTGGTINAQRYMDSVASLKSTLQMQYTDVVNVSNERSSNLKCNSDAEISEGGASSSPVGQSNCVILGKMLQLDSTKQNLVIKDVIGSADESLLVDKKNDIEVFRSYNIKAPNADLWSPKIYNIEWGALISGIVRPVLESPTESGNFTILILRSPSSGVTHTYIDSNNTWSDNDLDDMITDINYPKLNSYIDMCVDSNGLIASDRTKTAVRIYASATSANGVETIGDAESKCKND